MPGREISAGKTGQKKGLQDCDRSPDRPDETEHRSKEPDMMTTEQILTEIREANLSYLMLAQSLIRADREQALFRLGVSEDTADILATLSPAQIMKVAGGSTLLCQFRMNDDIVWNLLTNHGKVGSAANDGVSRLHASIVMAGRHQEAA
jgi:flagellar transcriptional activator FlhD